jgi:hypothetical protein
MWNLCLLLLVICFKFTFSLFKQKKNAYEITLLSVCHPCATDRQELHKYIPMAMDTHIPLEELLDMVFSTWSMSYKYPICRKAKQMISTSQNILLCVLWCSVMLLVVLC